MIEHRWGLTWWIREGDMAPWWLGLAWWDYQSGRAVLMPVPFNWLGRLYRIALHQLRDPTWGVTLDELLFEARREGYSAGFKAGVDHGREQEKQEILEAFDIELGES